MSSHILLFILYISFQLYYIGNSYYLSPNLFTFEQGQHFCSNHCDSNVASIHNASQFEEARKVIADSQLIYNHEYLPAYIGLIHTNNNWEWTDGTPFDFGTNISGGIWPWADNRPAYYTVLDPDCVLINHSTSSKWSDIGCNYRNRVLCNHCDGKLNKYIIGNKTTETIDEAISECEVLNHPTTLSSFHSRRDFEELRNLCRPMDISEPEEIEDCWTGLYTNNGWSDAYFYDNTTFNFGNIYGEYPWGPDQPDIGNQPGNHAIIHWRDPHDYLLNDESDDRITRRAYPLCNMPSELCYLEPTLTDMTTSSNNNCIRYGDPESEYSLAQFQSTQWYNGNGLLVIDLSFRIIDFTYMIPTTSPWYDQQHHALGINIAPCNEWADLKWLFISLYHNIYGYGLRLQYLNKENDIMISSFIFNQLIVDDSDLNDPSIYHHLITEVQRINDSTLHFNTSLDNSYHISKTITPMEIDDTTALNINKDGYSGYISIYTQHSKIEFKSLYISGTKVKINSSTLNHCPSQPTISPTTTAPTANPSISPSVSTSTSPSQFPSQSPSSSNNNVFSQDPTKLPSQSPSTLPSTAPIRNRENGVFMSTAAVTSQSIVDDPNTNQSVSVQPWMIAIYISILLCCCIIIIVVGIKYNRMRKRLTSDGKHMIATDHKQTTNGTGTGTNEPTTPKTPIVGAAQPPTINIIAVDSNESQVEPGQIAMFALESFEGTSDIGIEPDVHIRDLQKKESRKAEELYITHDQDNHLNETPRIPTPRFKLSIDSNATSATNSTYGESPRTVGSV